MHEALQARFTRLIASWRWDVALLQEVPPWWPAPLARACGAVERSAMTSRNSLLPLRRAIARRDAELMKSNGGGANALLARAEIVEHRALRLRVRPERRVAQLARLRSGVCVANYHASSRERLAEHELERLFAAALEFADGSPLVVGGDLNLRAPRAPARAVHAAARDVDHIFTLGLRPGGEASRPERRVTLRAGVVVELSDHPPLIVELEQGTLRSASGRGG